MLQEEGTANELVRREGNSSNSVLSASSCGGLLEGGVEPLGISLLEVCPSPHWLIQNSAAPGSRSQASLLENPHQNPWKITQLLPPLR